MLKVLVSSEAPLFSLQFAVFSSHASISLCHVSLSLSVFAPPSHVCVYSSFLLQILDILGSNFSALPNLT